MSRSPPSGASTNTGVVINAALRVKSGIVRTCYLAYCLSACTLPVIFVPFGLFIFYFSCDLESLHSEVPLELLPSFLGGKQDTSSCIYVAKEKEEHFKQRIEQARKLYKG